MITRPSSEMRQRVTAPAPLALQRTVARVPARVVDAVRRRSVGGLAAGVSLGGGRWHGSGLPRPPGEHVVHRGADVETSGGQS